MTSASGKKKSWTEPSHMKYLKFLVIFMAILIVCGVGFLIFALSTGMHHKNANTADSIQHTVRIPDNQMLLDYHIDDGRMIMHLMNRDDARRYWRIIDYQTGEELGRIDLVQ